MYRAGIEGILGLRREGDRLIIEPCLPSDWPEFTATLELANTRYDITVRQSAIDADASQSATLDGVAVALERGPLSVPLDGGNHTLSVQLRPKGK